MSASVSICIAYVHSVYVEKQALDALFLLLFLWLLGWFNLVNAVFLCDHTTSCEAYSFMSDAYAGFPQVLESWKSPGI